MTRIADTVAINQAGHLEIGGVDSLKLVKEFGTPVIAYDVKRIKTTIKHFKQAFETAGLPYRVTYASKAFSALAMYRLVADAGLGCDVVSGGRIICSFKGWNAARKNRISWEQ